MNRIAQAFSLPTLTLLALFAPHAAFAAPTIDSFDLSLNLQNEITATWATTGASEIYLRPSEGFIKDGAGTPILDGSHVFYLQPGVHTITLVALDENGDSAIESETLEIVGPKPVHVDQQWIDVNPFEPGIVQLTWAEDPSNAASAFVVVESPEIKVGGTVFFERPPAFILDAVPIDIDGAELQEAAEAAWQALPLEDQLKTKKQQTFEYKVKTCVPASWKPQAVPVTGEPLCGDAAIVTIGIDRVRFTRKQIVVGANSPEQFSIHWTDEAESSTTAYGVWSPDGLPVSYVDGSDLLTAETTANVDVTGLPDGRYSINLNTCLVSPSVDCLGSRPDAQNDMEVMEVIVDRSISWTEKSWTEHFEPDPTVYPVWKYQTPGRRVGLPLTLAMANDGSVFVLGEFSNSIFYVDSNGSMEAPLVPLDEDRKVVGGEERFVQDRPFSWYGNKASITTFAEGAIEVNGDFWFSQGGAGYFTWDRDDISRIVRFRPSDTDLPETLTDERFCVVTVPSFHPQVIGLASDGTNLWYTESRPRPIPQTPEDELAFPDESRLAYFPLDNVPCDNERDFSPLLDDEPPTEAEFFAGGPNQYCPDEETEGWCIRIAAVVPNLLTNAYPGVFDAETGERIMDAEVVSEVAIDPADGSVWFVGHFGNTVGRYDPTTSEVQLHPVKAPGVFATATIGAAPWRLEVHGDYVYVIEYGDASVLRVHKEDVINEQLPIRIDEMKLPSIATEVVNVGTLALHDGKLWFACGTPVSSNVNGSPLGYIDLSTWAADNDASNPTEGVIFTAVTDPGDPDRAQAWKGRLVTAVAVDDFGKVAVTDMFRRQLIVLTPKPGSP